MQLHQEVTEIEVKSTLFAMKNNKSPGPDGFPADFYKKAWNVVAAIKIFLSY